MIAAATARTDAYVAAMRARNLVPQRTLVLGTGARDASSISPTDHIDATDIRDHRIGEWLAAQGAGLVIYSGFGGQIVPRSLLACTPFLHVHAGRLPAYRGSTTLHYMILAEGRCAASAILLEAEIDTGRIVMERTYGCPPRGVELDAWDHEIRADLLVRVLEAGPPAIAAARPQAREGAETWYVIHPVLKRIAAERACR